jgi:hypothetical protein
MYRITVCLEPKRYQRKLGDVQIQLIWATIPAILKEMQDEKEKTNN